MAKQVTLVFQSQPCNTTNCYTNRFSVPSMQQYWEFWGKFIFLLRKKNTFWKISLVNNWQISTKTGKQIFHAKTKLLWTALMPFRIEVMEIFWIHGPFMFPLTHIVHVTQIDKQNTIERVIESTFVNWKINHWVVGFDWVHYEFVMWSFISYPPKSSFPLFTKKKRGF